MVKEAAREAELISSSALAEAEARGIQAAESAMASISRESISAIEMAKVRPLWVGAIGTFCRTAECFRDVVGHCAPDALQAGAFPMR